jgi:hypothetical protein
MTFAYRTALLALALAACGDDTATTSASGSTGDTSGASTSTSGGPTSGDPTATTGGPGTGSATGGATETSTTGVSTDATTSPGTTTEPGTTGEPGTTTSSTGDSSSGTTGGVQQCGVDGEQISAELAHVADPIQCAPLTFTGQRVSDTKGPTWMLDGCPCGANCLKPDPWTFTIQGPADWLPELPICPKIVVERQMGFGLCEFVAVSIWDDQQPNAPAFFHAGHGFSVVAEAQKELKVMEVPVQTCECDFCCGPSELWDLAFDHLGNQVTLAEADSAVLDKFTAINFESHSTGLCDAPLSVHWAVRQTP